MRQILEATGLIDVFSVYPSVEEAANSIRQARRGPRPRRCGSGPPWLPGLAASGPYAALPVVAWSGRCPGAECAGLNELRGIPALSGARREGQPRLVTTDYVVSRRTDMVVAVTAA